MSMVNVTVRKVLLGCGVAAAALFVGTDIVGALRYPGYSYTAHSGTLLTAIGAPTRPLVLPLSLASQALMLAFGLGLWDVAGRNRALRCTAAFLVGSAVIGAAGGVRGSSDATGVALGAAMVVGWLLAIGFGAAASRRWVRFYSLGTLAAFLMLAILGVWRPTPLFGGRDVSLVGIQERTMFYGYLLWVAALAVSPLHATRAVAPSEPEWTTATPAGSPSVLR